MQSRNILFGLGLFGLLSAAAGSAWSASLSGADKQFVMMAAKTDMTEAHEGQMAEDRANQSEVKELGKALVEDHTQSYEQLTELASKDGVSIPKGINSAKDPTIARLDRLTGAGFDRAFTADEIAAHRHALAVYKRESEHAKDPDVKAYAAKMIPVLEKHLKLAEECARPVKHS
jgi:putative membrane protein